MTALCSGKICTIFPEKGALNLWKACTIALEYSKTAEQLTRSKIRKKDQKIIKDIIENNQKDFWIYWNEHTDGLDVDLNQALGLIHY